MMLVATRLLGASSLQQTTYTMPFWDKILDELPPEYTERSQRAYTSVGRM